LKFGTGEKEFDIQIGSLALKKRSLAGEKWSLFGTGEVEFDRKTGGI
jgi:hypothetical protein